MINTLTKEYLQKKVPSIFTEGNAERTSDKYQHISTAKVMAGLLKEGFIPTWAAQCRCRITSKQAYTKHILRFRHLDARPTSLGLYPELVLVNSHDGLSSYRLMAGVYRIVCENGLIAGNSYNEIRIRHQGDIIGEVIEGTYKVIETAKNMIESAEKMSSVILTPPEREIFAEAAHAVRFDENPAGLGVEPLKLVAPRRLAEIEKNDLFTVFNIAQENIIKGGVRGCVRNARGQLNRTSTRAVKSIDQNTSLNRALWTLAEKMMELKGK